VQKLTKIEADLLNQTYAQLYSFFEQDDEVFLAFFQAFGGQQLNLAEHIYSRDKVREQLLAKAAQGPLDILAESERVSYGKRWIRNLEKMVQQEQLVQNENN